MPEIVRRTEPFSSRNKQITEVLKSLPLERCSFERNTLTGEVGFVAPEGYTFRVTGEFTIWEDKKDSWDISRPEESMELLIAEHPAQYASAKEEAGEDEDLLYETFLERIDLSDYYDNSSRPPESFSGTWFVISPNIDGTSTFLEQGESRTEPVIKIKSAADIVAKQKTRILPTENLADILPTDSSLAYEASYTDIEWFQIYTILEPADSRVELVVEKEGEKGLYLPIFPPHEALILPFDKRTDGMKSTEYARITAQLWGAEDTDERRLSLMRDMRRKGIFFSDDPLVGMVFPGKTEGNDEIPLDYDATL